MGVAWRIIGTVLLCICAVDAFLPFDKKDVWNEDSSERYDIDGDLRIPEEAQNRPADVFSRAAETEADRVRKNSPPKYEDDRSLCYCNYAPEYCGGFDNQTCMKHIEAACFHFTEENYNRKERRMETTHLFGCAPLTRGSGGSYFTCRAHVIAHAKPKSIACCYEGSFCNYNLSVPAYVNVSPEGFMMDGPISRRVSKLVILPVLFVILCIVAAVLYPKRAVIARLLKPPLIRKPVVRDETIDSEKNLMIGDMMSSGSGSGMASLNQRTIAQNLQFLSDIGKGRYGEVKKAIYRGDRIVAVKTFYTTEEESWKNEKEIYQTQMLNHENILQFVAADIGSEDSITRMLLITDYHELGSLYEYLQSGTTFSVKEALQLAHSAACGLVHLHSPIRGTGTLQKPAIAHRDIKSKNIIVKRHGVCCIADFGLALSENMVNERRAINIQVGTKRYMAPEVLDKSINVNNFHHFKMADVYSFSLVIWEILRRIQDVSPLARASDSDSGIGSSGDGSGSGKATVPAIVIRSRPVSIERTPLEAANAKTAESTSCGNANALVKGKSLLDSGVGSIASSSAAVASSRLGDPRGAADRLKPQLISSAVPAANFKHTDDSFSVTPRPPVQPFDGLVDSDPSFEQMRRLVCVQKQRPLLEDSWLKDPCLKDICDLLKECWDDQIGHRHTVFRMKRTIVKTIEKHDRISALEGSSAVSAVPVQAASTKTA